MFIKLVVGMVGALTLVVLGGLAYRKERQRWIAKVLAINTAKPSQPTNPSLR